MLMMVGNISFAQNTISGSVQAEETGEALIGAIVKLRSADYGAVTDMDGNFTISDVPDGEYRLSVTSVGFKQTILDINLTADFNAGTISLSEDSFDLSEVVVVGRGVIDIESDRQTPIAVTTIGEDDIQQRAVGIEFPEAIEQVPSVYVSNQIGFGDSQMFLRGFDQTNTAFLLNGQPINGMEDGRMYWSNWSGMTDIANAVQVQRGLGSSKLAISEAK